MDTTRARLGAAAATVVLHGGRWAVVRLGVDGSAELATPVVRGRVDYQPFSLPLT